MKTVIIAAAIVVCLYLAYLAANLVVFSKMFKAQDNIYTQQSELIKKFEGKTGR